MQAKKVFRVVLASLLLAAWLPAGAQTPQQKAPEKRPPADKKSDSNAQGGPEKKPPTQKKKSEKKPPKKQGAPEKKPPA